MVFNKVLLYFCILNIFFAPLGLNAYPDQNRGDFYPEPLSAQDPIHQFTPYIRWEDVEPCSLYFDVEVEYKKATQCSKQFYPKGVDLIKPPGCFIIKSNALGVMKGSDGNYLAYGFSQIKGFYEPEMLTTFIVEDPEITDTYRHEVQHHFLHLIEGDGNAAHDHPIWYICEPPYYTPSEEVMEQYKDRTTEVVINYLFVW